MDAARRPRFVPPQDRVPYNAEPFEHFDRQLGRPQLAAIGISGTLGIGLFVTSGELISISGSLGAVLAYIFASIICACVMYTLAEMVSARPVTGAIVDFPHTFCSGELGFAVGIAYWLSQSLCMATLNAATARVADSFSETGLDKGQRAGLILGLCFVTGLSNMIGVKLYGQLERVVAIFKMTLIFLLAVLSIGVNFGLGGARTGGQHANFTTFGLPPNFKPVGYRDLNESSVVTPNGTDTSSWGISGSHGGRLFAVLAATALAMFNCMGGDQVIMTAGEAKDPWNDLPAVTRLIYAIPLICYPILTMLAGFNINYADKNLYKPWANDNNPLSHSPFIIAIRYASLGALPTVLNTCFLLSAYTCGNTALYVSSRTLFIVAQNYGTPRIRNFLAKTNAHQTPQKAIMVTSLFGLLGLLGLKDDSFNQPILTLSALFTGAVGCVYMSECWAFVRFKQGLDALHKRRKFSRNHKLYERYLFRGHWQPFVAYVGMFGTACVIVFSGIPSIWLLCNRHHLQSAPNLKGTGLIGADLIGAYSGPVIFAALYFGRRFFYGSEPRDPSRFHIAMYVLPDTSVFESATQHDGPIEMHGQRRNETGLQELDPAEKKIKKHLEGHGRTYRGFWTESTMFFRDRDFKRTDDDEGGSEASGSESEDED